MKNALLFMLSIVKYLKHVQVIPKQTKIKIKNFISKIIESCLNKYVYILNNEHFPYKFDLEKMSLKGVSDICPKNQTFAKSTTFHM